MHLSLRISGLGLNPTIYNCNETMSKLLKTMLKKWFVYAVCVCACVCVCIYI